MVARRPADHVLLRHRPLRNERRRIGSGPGHHTAAELVGQRSGLEALKNWKWALLNPVRRRPPRRADLACAGAVVEDAMYVQGSLASRSGSWRHKRTCKRV